MSITDEDLQYMTDAMWADTLLPDIADMPVLPDIYGIDIGADGEQLSDLQLDPKANAKNNGEGSSRKKPVSASKTASTTKPKTRPNKAKKPLEAHPSTDIYLSSPVEARPKKNTKMSKSMKGASQNESQRGRPSGPSGPHKTNPMFPELETDNGDPYELPMSPKSTHRPAVVEFDKKAVLESTSPAAAPKPSSPVPAPVGVNGGLMPSVMPSAKKGPVKGQKRVAKRSFLDPISTPLQSENEAKTNKVQPKAVEKEAPAATAKPPPAPKAAKKAPAKRATKPKEPAKPKEPVKPKEPAKPRETKKKTVSRPPASAPAPPVKEEKMDDAEDEFRIPDDIELPALPVENITKKLRPRGERAPILISSDGPSSDEEEDEEEEEEDELSDAAYVPDTGMTSFTTPLAQTLVPESAAKQSSKSSDTQAQMTVSEKKTAPAANNAKHLSTKMVTKVKEEMVVEEEETIVRGRQLVDKPTSHKRERSPASTSTHHQKEKKQRPQEVHADKAHTQQAPAEAKGRKVMQKKVVPSDPFVESMDEDEPQQTQTHFTAKLLQSTAPVQPPPQAAKPAKPAKAKHGVQQDRRTQAQNQPQFAQQFSHHFAQQAPQVQQNQPAHQTQAYQTPHFSRDQLDGLAHLRHSQAMPNANVNANATDSDGIAREMMRLLSASSASNYNYNHHQSDQPASASASASASARDIWLDETDPYKETGQIMGYVCKTILRHLKSKEAAIDDVADEYHQRGGAVLARLTTLHAAEKSALAHAFENNRQQSLAAFTSAQRDIHLLASRLERVNLVPVIQNVLADNAGSRMRLLQSEVV